MFKKFLYNGIRVLNESGIEIGVENGTSGAHIYRSEESWRF